MTIVVLSAASVVLLSIGGPALLARASGGAGLSPRAMLALWTSASAAWLLAVGTLVLMALAEVMGPGIKGVVTACVTLVHALRANEDQAAVAGLALLTAAVGGRLLWVLLRRHQRSTRWRRDHRREVAAHGGAAVIGGRRVWLVDDERPDAYCVPGRRGMVVLTRGAVRSLSPRQMGAVLAHEDAHLRGRHHLLVSCAMLLNAAFPGVPLLRAAAREVPVLVEWAADDAAAGTVGTAPLLHALGAMTDPAGSAPPAQALAASGACVLGRARRLLPESGARRPGGTRTAVAIAALALLAAPAVLTAAAAVSMIAASPPCACTL